MNIDIANAVRAIQIYTGIEQISILGYCFGALLGLMYSALHSGNVKNLVTLDDSARHQRARAADRAPDGRDDLRAAPK